MANTSRADRVKSDDFMGRARRKVLELTATLHIMVRIRHDWPRKQLSEHLTRKESRVLIDIRLDVSYSHCFSLRLMNILRLQKRSLQSLRNKNKFIQVYVT